MRVNIGVVLLATIAFTLIVFSVQVVAAVGLSEHARRADYIVFITGGTLTVQGYTAAASLYDVAGFAIAGGLLYLVTALYTGFDWPFVYLDTLAWLNRQNNHYGMLPNVMSNWYGLLLRFGAGSAMLWGVLIAASLTALIYGWWRSDKAAQPRSPLVGRLELQLAATAFASTLTSLYLYTHDLVLLLFPGVVLLAWAAQHHFPRWLVALLLGSVAAAPFILFGPPIDALAILAVAGTFAANFVLLTQRFVTPTTASMDAEATGY